MTCHRDFIVCVLYDLDVSMTIFYTDQIMARLGAQWSKSSMDIEKYKVVFFLLMDRDMAMKETILDGLANLGIKGMSESKAERFFLSLRDEVIEPWLSNEELPCSSFLDKVASLYWSC